MDKILSIKGSIVAVLSAIGMLLGWRGLMIAAWAFCMFLDYVSGSFAAKYRGEWSSAKAREGIWHKAGMIIVVTAAFLSDLVISMACTYLPQIGIEWPVVVAPVVLTWYILTELGSILENAEKMGAKIPGWLVNGLKNGIEAVEHKTE